MSTRSQMEIMGLVVIVILISLGMLFAIQFIVLRKPADTKGIFTQRQLAANTLNSFALSTTTCQGLDVTELVQECGLEAASEVDCDGDEVADACPFVKGLADEILSETLKKWGKKYTFRVLEGKRELVKFEHKGCPQSKDTSVYPVPSRYGGENLVMRLEVCS